MKILIMLFLATFIVISCGDEMITSKIEDTKPETKEILPLPSQNGITINSGGNLVKSDSYKFKFVVGMNQTVNPKEVIKTKKYSFKFSKRENVVNKKSKTKYRFTLTK